MEHAVQSQSNQSRALLAAIVIILLVLVLRSAWVADDAYITLRTVDNWVRGHGLRWNGDERVQAYTHPLWMLILSAAYAVTREAFVTTAVVGVITTAIAATVIVKLAKSTLHAFVALLLLALSRAFIDFSTSGLENPLSHVLIGTFVWLYAVRPGTFRGLTLVTALMALNRADSILLVLPALAHASAVAFRTQGARATVRDALIGLSPWLAWEAFSLFYYGFLVPNTAFAKLNTGIPRLDLLRQGALYMVLSIGWDPALLAGLALGLGAAFMTRERRLTVLAAGALLYLAYVARVGGDFMMGRFLTMPLFASACLLARSSFTLERPTSLAIVVAPFALLWFHPNATELWPAITDFGRTGIADERAYYRNDASLMLSARNHDLPSYFWAGQGRQLKANNTKVDVSGNVGYRGFYAGPDVHIIDFHALTDPLLARLPARYEPRWRPGHYARIVPANYPATVETGQCTMPDPQLCAYYEKLRLIVSGDLWSWERVQAIAAMNLGRYDGLIDFDRYRYPEVLKVPLQDISSPVAEPATWDGPGMRVFGNDGIEIALGKVVHAAHVDLYLDGNDVYELTFKRAGETIATDKSRRSGGLKRHVTTPEDAAKSGFDTLVIRPLEGDARYSVGSVQLGPEIASGLASAKSN